MLEPDKKLEEYIKDDDSPTFEFRGNFDPFMREDSEYCQVVLNFVGPVRRTDRLNILGRLAFNLRETDTVGSFNELIHEYEGIEIDDQKLYEIIEYDDSTEVDEIYLQDENETLYKYCNNKRKTEIISNKFIYTKN